MATNKDFVVKNGLEVGGNIAVTGTVDGRDLANDGTKLNTVETNADVTDATNVTAAGALMDSELTSIASIKALNQGASTGDSPTFAAATISGTLGAVNATLSGNLSAVNTTLTGYLRGPASFVIDPAVHGNNSGTVVIAGNLQVDGTQTQINSTTLTVDDINLTLASGAANAAAANGAGITIDGASASLTYASSGDKFVFNKNLEVKSDATYVTVDSADHNVALLGPRSGAGAGMDQGYLRLKSAGVNKVALDTAGHTFFNGGNVGIGITAPTTELQINSATDPKIRLESNESGTKRLDLWIDGGTAIGYIGADQSASQLAFRTVGTERIRIDADGKVGIGTSSPSSQFVVAASNGGKGIETQVTTHASNNQFILAYDRANSAYLNMELSALNFGIATNNGTNRFKILANGKVGIGTTDPDYPLEIAGASSTSIAYQRTGVSAKKWGFHTDNDNTYWQNITDSVLALTIKNNGNVGIDETTPLAKLHVVGGRANGTVYNTIIAAGGVNSTDGSGARIILTGCENDPLARGTVIEGISTGTGNSHKLNFKTNSGSNTPATRMTISHTGNVGIGTDDPGCALDVTRTSGWAEMHLDGASGGDLILKDNNVSYGEIYAGNGHGMVLKSYASQDMYFLTNAHATSKMIIKSAGNVGIGTTDPGEKLEVNGAINIRRVGDHPAIRFMEDANTRAYMGSGDWAVNGGADDDFGISSSNTGDLLLGTSAGSERMRITNGGNVIVAAGKQVNIGATPALVSGNNPRHVLHIGGTTVNPSYEQLSMASGTSSSGEEKTTIRMANVGNDFYLTNNYYNWGTHRFDETNEGQAFFKMGEDGRFSFGGRSSASTSSPVYNAGIGYDGSITAGNSMTMVNGLGKLNVWGNSDVSDADVELRMIDNDTTAGSAVPTIAFYKGSGGGPVRMADFRVNDVNGFEFRKNNGTDLLNIGMNGQVRSYYGFSEGSTFANYYTKRSPQLTAGSSSPKKARVGRLYFTAGHWSSNGINLHARVGSQYYSNENRTYHFSAQYTDGAVSYQLIEPHSKHANNTRIYLGAVTTAHTYSGQPCKYQDIWVEANSYKRVHVDFTSMGNSSGSAIHSSNITSGWGGVVVYDSLQDAADVSSMSDELVNFKSEFFLTTSSKVNDTLNQGEYFGFDQLSHGSSLNYNTGTYKYKAPANGIYQFSANVYRNSSTGGNISFRKTDASGNSPHDFGRQPQTGPSGDFVIHMSAREYLNKGELVGVYNYGATFSNFYGNSSNQYSQFSGEVVRFL